MKFGLTQDIIDGISSVLEQYPKVDKAFVFGSRAKGNYRPDSDIDIALTGQDITYKDITGISVKIDDLNIGLSVDLLNYHTIKEPALKEHIDRVGIEFYSRWKEYTLESISYKITDGAHLSPKDFMNGRIMFSVKDMIDNGFDYSKPKTISQEDFNSLERQGCKPEIDDILIAKDGSVLKHIFRVTNEPDYVLLSSIAIVKPIKEKVDPSFLVYTLKSPIITDTILTNFVSGSGVPRIVLKDFKKVVVSLPPLPEQTAIASILSSLDDKIDLLQRQNKTLEQLAETLFRQWFVEEAEVDLVPLKKYVDVIDNRGKTPPFSDINTDYPIVEVKSLSNNDRFVNYDACEKFVNEETYNTWFRKGHPIINDILISTVGSIGEMAYVIENKGGIAQNVIGLRAKGISPYYLYQYLSLPKTRNLIKDLDIGAVQPSIKVPHLLDIEIIIPKNKQLIKDFEAELVPMFEKMKINHHQIRTLTQTRDTLLPKLMSGEVRVEM